MTHALEALNRRAFLAGLMVNAAGLLVPKPLLVAVPAPRVVTPREFREAVERYLASCRQSIYEPSWEVQSSIDPNYPTRILTTAKRVWRTQTEIEITQVLG